MTDDFNAINHSVSLRGRNELSVSAVEDVDSFDECEIIALTSAGELDIKGEGLKILSFSTQTGQLKVSGERIDALTYTGEKREKGFFRRLLR